MMGPANWGQLDGGLPPQGIMAVFETESQEFLSLTGCVDRGLTQSQAETLDLPNRSSKGHS